MRTPRFRSVARFSCVAACCHMFTFIAGASTTGAVEARYRVERKSSANPRANFPRISAVAGATSSKSVRCATAICSMADSKFASPPSEFAKRSVMTFWPLSAAKVSGVMNSRAARVITTCTVCPSSCRRRTSSADLYAATPPVTPRVMRMEHSRALLAPLTAVLFVLCRHQVGEFVLDQTLIHFFARDARSFLRARIFHHRWSAGHNLAGASCSQDHIGKLALGSFGLHAHLCLTLQRTPELDPRRCGAARSNSAARLQ